MKNKLPWSRAEKLLVLTPLICGLIGGIAWWKNKSGVSIPVSVIDEMAFSPDGRHLAVLVRRSNGAYCNAGKVFNTHSGALETQLQVSMPSTWLGTLSWSPDNSEFATGYSDFRKGTYIYKYRGKNERNFLMSMAIWDAKSGRQSALFPCAPANEYSWTQVSWARDGHLWNEGVSPALFDIRLRKRLRRFGPKADFGSFQVSTFNFNHKLVAITSPRGVSIYEVPNGNLLRKIDTPDSPYACWSQDSDVLAVTWANQGGTGTIKQGRLKLMDARTGRTLPVPLATNPSVIKFGRQGQIALIDTVWRRLNFNGGMKAESSKLILWDYMRGKQVWDLTTPKRDDDHFESLSVSPDGKLVYAAEFHRTGDGTTVRTQASIWDAKTGQITWSIPFEPSLPTWSPDSKRLAFYQDGRIQISPIVN